MGVIESSIDYSQGQTLKKFMLPEIMLENLKQVNLTPVSPPSNSSQEVQL